MLYYFCFFCFKQKTAYEMRISDWSSDVCSSDLDGHALGHAAIAAGAPGDFHVDHFAAQARGFAGGDAESVDQPRDFAARVADRFAGFDAQRQRQFLAALGEARDAVFKHVASSIVRERSEENTSELQSQMRSSYAVFCLKKIRHTST